MSKLVNMRRSTQLLDLPEELLGAVLRQLRDGNSRLQVFMTSKRLATALLQHTPSIQLTHPLAVDLLEVASAEINDSGFVGSLSSLAVYSIGCLVFSRVSAACSWRQLEVEEMDWLSAAHLPLHSLTHPLQLAQLGGVGPVGAEVLAAAELNLCERHKAGLEVITGFIGSGKR
ncbi:hypothetical protein HaLaN_05806 [Haematococcus lacustris]|uniref:F-box domain-containing protein n=1 Tax=Haematococcus lacustris TaxID=44745 RepID=A0A699YME8_HAELA|nr:hypothetical protein HaLaN_05806 [Haematococcus lacustris]